MKDVSRFRSQSQLSFYSLHYKTTFREKPGIHSLLFGQSNILARLKTLSIDGVFQQTILKKFQTSSVNIQEDIFYEVRF